MAGVVPAIHGKRCGPLQPTPNSHHASGLDIHQTNQPNGILYLGVTSSLRHRVWQHREGLIDGFTKRHGLKRLIYAEPHAGIALAIGRERNMKHWSRTWKVRLILASNPEWADLYEHLV